ncbi:hypothetical protein ACFRI7_18810 [Streptomyces sp. NPDC056716]|uniref:hypothetical protein n=1 Tax=unclassified Streptomyces TaxID=2593676 RepID=UPI00367FABDD
MPPRKLIDTACSGFDEMTGLLLSTGGWGWHSEVGPATLRLILAGTLDRHSDRADLLSTAAPHLQRRVLDHITGNLAVTAGGLYSPAAGAMPYGAPTTVDGPDHRGLGGVDSRGALGGPGRARAFVDHAPLDERGRDKLGHLNAERVLHLPRPATS